MTDPLKIVQRLRAAGMPEAQAEVIANELWEMQKVAPASAAPTKSARPRENW
jgi:hypothetical protein